MGNEGSTLLDCTPKNKETVGTPRLQHMPVRRGYQNYAQTDYRPPARDERFTNYATVRKAENLIRPDVHHAPATTVRASSDGAQLSARYPPRIKAASGRDMRSASTDTGSASNSNKVMLLHYAAEAGDVNSLKELLEQSGGAFRANSRDGHGNTALHKAAFNGKVEACKLLVKNGARVEFVNIAGKTALDFASANGHSECAEALLQYLSRPSPETIKQKFRNSVQSSNSLKMFGPRDSLGPSQIQEIAKRMQDIEDVESPIARDVPAALYDSNRTPVVLKVTPVMTPRVTPQHTPMHTPRDYSVQDHDRSIPKHGDHHNHYSHQDHNDHNYDRHPHQNFRPKVPLTIPGHQGEIDVDVPPLDWSNIHLGAVKRHEDEEGEPLYSDRSHGSAWSERQTVYGGTPSLVKNYIPEAHIGQRLHF